METASDLAMWTALVAFAMPVLVALVQRPRWQQHTRAIVTGIVSIIVGGGTVYFTTPSLFDDGTAMTTVILTVLVGSTAAYNTFWKPLGIRRLEDATSPGDTTIADENALAADIAKMLAGSPVETGGVAGGNILDRAPVAPDAPAPAPLHGASGTIVPNGDENPRT